jgi:hypothetical protein
MVSDHFRSTQTGTIHFSYLARDGGGGLLNVARSWDEHFVQLAGAVRSVDGHRDRIDGFLRTFVRPNGLDRPAAPLAIDAIVETAQEDREPVREGGPLRWIVGTGARGLGRMHQLLIDLRPESIRKRLKRRRKIRAQAERRRDRQTRTGADAKPAKTKRAAIKAERAAAKVERANPPKGGRFAKSQAPEGGEKAERAAIKAARAKEKAGSERPG